MLMLLFVLALCFLSENTLFAISDNVACLVALATKTKTAIRCFA